MPVLQQLAGIAIAFAFAAVGILLDKAFDAAGKKDHG